MKAMMTATVPSMIGQFNMNNIKILIDLGYDVDVTCNFNDHSVWSEEKINKLKKNLRVLNVNFYQIDFERSMFKVINHIRSYKQIKKLMNERKYTLIHTHTPISSFITRIAFKHSNIYNSCRMIYTAHGFHFFKGNNPVKNFIFRNIERYVARYTDVLITINKEDYAAAKKFKLKKNGKVEYVPGVGIDIEKINSIHGDKKKLCAELNIPETSILLLSVGELNENKNHKVMIDALPSLPENIHYVICGTGKLYDEYIEKAKNLNIANRLHLLGYRDDVIKIMKSCDIFVFPSKREGLSVALMEAMACGLLCVTSKIRGNEDLTSNVKGSRVVETNNSHSYYKSIQSILNEYKNKEKKINRKSMVFFSTIYVNKIMENIYK